MKCIICHNSKIVKIPLIHEVSAYDHKAYPLYRCLSCGFIRPFPLPYTNETKGKIYDDPENILFYDKNSKRIMRNTKEFQYYYKHFEPFIKLIRKYKIMGQALDIGCGVGHLMDLLSKEQFKVEGMEVSPILKKALKGRFTVHCKTLQQLQKNKKRYNLITFNQVLEHVEDPESFLRSVNGLLAEKGYVILAVPYIHGLVPQILRTRWYGLGFGQHLNFFSKKSLDLLLSRTGFEVCEMNVSIVDYAHPKFPRFLNLFANIMMKIIVYAGLGDNLFIVARKTVGVRK